MSKLIKYEGLQQLVENIRRGADVHIITVTGCFDLFHYGHARRLEAAKKLGDFLIVGVNSDISVKLQKGPLRPIIPEQHRAEIVAALSCVDYVTIFHEPTSHNFQKIVNPTYHVTGSEHFEKYGPAANILYCPRTDTVSTSSIIDTILERYHRSNGECGCRCHYDLNLQKCACCA